MSRPHYPSSRHDRPHARLYDHELEHPAWRELSGNAFKLIARFLALWRPEQPNCFAAGGATVARLINVDEKTGRKLVDELIDAGHLREERRGRNRGLVKTRERMVSLTRYDTETTVGNPAFPIEAWRERKEAENLPQQDGKKAGFKNQSERRKGNPDGAELIPLKTGTTRI
ncbi:MAG: hypothetical protein AAF583_05565 [Pseudomonadota bacterium]